MSGAIAGMIGLPYLLADPNFLKYGDAFPTTIGFTGLGLALLGRNNPIGIAAAAIVWATIERATQRLGPIGIPPEIGRILQGSFLLTAVIAYEVINRRNDAAAARAPRRPPAGSNSTTRPPPDRMPSDRRSAGMTIVADTARRRRESATRRAGARRAGCRSPRWSLRSPSCRRRGSSPTPTTSPRAARSAWRCARLPRSASPACPASSPNAAARSTSASTA